ncbi:hypothetical protein BGZ63DRAFT_269807 [Mariannaea sp. PMI_226]|nr:hypothetical protein BGZ63DRAFT_269807 [Mariannaea sp. PMI_226]
MDNKETYRPREEDNSAWQSAHTSIASHEIKKAPRILACVLCQQRKKRCNRQNPCSNCIKLKVTCIPSTPAAPRKRRRPNQELLERLARCEALLRHCTCIPQSLANSILSGMPFNDSHESPEGETTTSLSNGEASPK